MSRIDTSLIETYMNIAADNETESIVELRKAFIGDLPSVFDGESVFSEIQDKFASEEIPVICAELVLTITANCERDDFHNWDYEHIAFIIELSNKYNFQIPQNLLNGLPSQLILLVDADRIDDSGCK